MAANAAAVDIISNNLANLNTTGYKATTAQFQDMMAQSMGVGGPGNQIGMGVGPVSTTRVFSQGSIQATGGAMDAAIQGNGFFVVRDSSGQTLFTRAGDFKLDSSGNLITQNGDNVQGWNAVGGAVNPNGPTGNISFPTSALLAATPTTQMTASLNLNAAAQTGAVGATFGAPIQIVDSLGATHVLTATFTKTAANQWSYSVTIPQSDLGTGGLPEVAKGTVKFDATGQLTDPAATAGPIVVKVKGLADSAADMTINWDLFDSDGKGLITQFAQTSALAGTTQDGFPAGQIVKIGMQDGGLIVASYSNGQQATVAQVAIAAIRNPDSLVSVGNNNLQASAATSAPAIGAADSGGRGKIVAGALESSTVDIAKEFTNLITVQRSYQAASKIVTASDQILQETVALIR
jgi:flagellar hook protein FlgE